MPDNGAWQHQGGVLLVRHLPFGIASDVSDALRKRWISGFRSWFDKLTTNGINNLPFVLSLSKDLFSVSLTNQQDVNQQQIDDDGGRRDRLPQRRRPLRQRCALRR